VLWNKMHHQRMILRVLFQYVCPFRAKWTYLTTSRIIIWQSHSHQHWLVQLCCSDSRRNMQIVAKLALSIKWIVMTTNPFKYIIQFGAKFSTWLCYQKTMYHLYDNIMSQFNYIASFENRMSTQYKNRTSYVIRMVFIRGQIDYVVTVKLKLVNRLNDWKVIW